MGRFPERKMIRKKVTAIIGDDIKKKKKTKPLIRSQLDNFSIFAMLALFIIT